MHLQLDLLAHFDGQVAHDARQLGPGIADRLHARLHHAFLQVGGDVRQPLQRHGELAVLVAAHHLQQLVAGQHQLGNQGHQVFEQFDVDADGLGGNGEVRRRRRSPRGDGRRCRRDLRRSGRNGRLRGYMVLRFCRMDGLGNRRGNDHRLGFGLRYRRRFWRRCGGCWFRCGGCWFRCGDRSRRRLRRGSGRCGSLQLSFGRGVQLGDQLLVVTFRFGLVRFDMREDHLDAIKTGQNQGHGLGSNGKFAVPELAKHIFARVGDHFQPRQAEKAAGALYRVNQSKNIGQNFRFRILFEFHQFHVERGEAFRRFCQELA